MIVDGGIPPYTYSWSNGAATEDIHQLASGIYTVKVTDSKGMISIVQTEIKHPFFESQIIKKNISCNGLSDGTAEVFVTGGTPPYSYIWSTLSTNKTLTNIGEGNYTVLISDARSCILRDTVVIEPVLKLVFNTIYNCIDSTKNSIDLSVVQASSDAPAAYCLPVSQCYFNNHAFRFTLNKYTDTRSECNENAYSFNKDQVIAVLNQDSINTLDMLSNGSDLGFGVWIDLNKDGDFSDTLEFIYASPTTSMFSNFHTTFKLPSFVTSGKTRLRVRSKVNFTVAATESCGNFSYGYSRDYIIEIQGGLSYIWSNGTIAEDLSNIALGTYSVSVKNNSGCTVTDTAIISGPTLFALGDIKNESCKLNDGSIKLSAMGGVPPFLYLWSTLQISPVLTNLSAGTFSVEITDSRGCRTNQTYTVKLACSPVWPGDSNNDKTADNNDLLPLGLYFSETGLSRDSVSNTWVGQESTDWLKQQLNGVNLKNADCNGDGTINLNDTLAIHLNYGLKHSKVVPVNTSVPLNPELYFVTLKKSYIAGEDIEAEIWAATNGLPLDAIYGLAFKLKLDPAIIDLNTVTLTLSNTWFGTPQNRITFYKILKPEARADVSLTKIDHKNLNGFGKVANLKFKTTDAIVSPYLLILSFNEYKALDALGNVKAMNTVADSLTILPVTTAMQEHTTDFNLTVFPNPFTDFTNIHYDLNTASIVKLEIFNSIGECISQPLNGKQATGAYDYSFSAKALGLAGGIYFIKLTINGKSYFRKMIELK